jgi:predicted DNA-binding transcriptional regulator YafY
LPGYRTDVTGLTRDEARALGFLLHSVLTTGGAQEDLGLGAAARSAVLNVMRAVPEPFRPAATATSQRILVDPAGWMRAPDPVGELGVLQTAVFTDRRLRLRYRSSGHGEPEASRFAAVKAARTLLSFAGHVEVTSPPEVRADLAEVAAEVVACYQDDRQCAGLQASDEGGQT